MYTYAKECIFNKKKLICSIRYPKAFTNSTITEDDGYPLYRRRAFGSGGFKSTVLRNSTLVEIDNRFIVPYNPLLLKTFNAHINVEWCHSVKSIKYICKYINKGSDQAIFALTNKFDEVGIYQIGRYISTNEAVWKILGFPLHQRHPVVQHLAVHLENGQRIYFSSTDNVQHILNNSKNTTLLAFFNLCQVDDFAKTLLYHEVPKYFTWDSNNHTFSRRKRGKLLENNIYSTDAIGRVYTVHPNNAECYFLRLLLHVVKGPTSFQNLRAVNNIIHPTFQQACKILNLIDDDSHWSLTLTEASLNDSSSKLRYLFVLMLSACQISDPLELWILHRNSMSEDILHQSKILDLNSTFNDTIYNKTLRLLNNILLKMNGKQLQYYNLPLPECDSNDSNVNMDNQFEYMRETQYDKCSLRTDISTNEPRLTNEQRCVFDTVYNSVLRHDGKLFFIDAPGGTGKTFLLKLLLSKIRQEEKISLCVASSGIAATLLPGGRTAHSMFKLPLTMINNDLPVCNIKKGSAMAKLIQECKLLVWDECTMAHKKAIEALNRSLIDLTGKNDIMGRITIVFSGN